MPSAFLTLLIARRTFAGVSAAFPAFTRGVCNCTGYVARFRFNQVPVVALFWWYLIPNNEVGCAPLNPSCTITSVATVPPGSTSTVIVCVGLIGSAATTWHVPRFVVSVVSYTWIVWPTYTSAAPFGTLIVKTAPATELIVPSTPLPAVWINLSRNARNCFIPFATSRFAAFSTARSRPVVAYSTSFVISIANRKKIGETCAT